MATQIKLTGHIDLAIQRTWKGQDGYYGGLSAVGEEQVPFAMTLKERGEGLRVLVSETHWLIDGVREEGRRHTADFPDRVWSATKHTDNSGGQWQTLALHGKYDAGSDRLARLGLGSCDGWQTVFPSLVYWHRRFLYRGSDYEMASVSLWSFTADERTKRLLAELYEEVESKHRNQ